MNFLLIGSMYRSVFTITRRQSESSNQHDAVMPLRPNPHQTVTFSTLTGDIDVLSRSPESHVLSVHVIIKMESCLVAEKMKSKSKDQDLHRFID